MVLWAMPDTAALPRPAPLLDLGVYTDLPMWKYLADPGLSGSGFHKLGANPPEWRWARPDNPLYKEPLDSAAKMLGTVCHKVLLEGLEAYEAEFCPKPDKKEHPDALDTADDLKAYCAEHGLKVSGKKDELIDRVLAHNPRAKIWDVFCEGIIAGRTPIGFDMHAQALLLDKYVRENPDYSKLLSGGLSEVSIFWEEDGVRYKSRIDYLRPTAVVDVKTFGRPPMRSLIRDFLADRVSHGDDMQAVHNWRAAQQIPLMLKEGRGVSASREKLDLLERIADRPKVFIWLGLRVNGPPCGLGVRFDAGTIPWSYAEQKIANAVKNFRDYRERFGDGIWVRSEGIITPEAALWPSWGGEIPE